MWEYIAGLFDGDGSVSISKSVSNKIPSINLKVVITGDRKHMETIKRFLEIENIKSNIYCGSPQNSLVIHNKKKIKRFLQNILPYVIYKKNVCKIMLEAVNLKERLKSKGYGEINKNLHLFDGLRHELHKYSRKGPRKLKSWY